MSLDERSKSENPFESWAQPSNLLPPIVSIVAASIGAVVFCQKQPLTTFFACLIQVFGMILESAIVPWNELRNMPQKNAMPVERFGHCSIMYSLMVAIWFGAGAITWRPFFYDDHLYAVNLFQNLLGFCVLIAARRANLPVFLPVVLIIYFHIAIVVPHPAIDDVPLEITGHLIVFTLLYYGYVFITVWRRVNTLPLHYLFAAMYWILTTSLVPALFLYPSTFGFIVWAKSSIESQAIQQRRYRPHVVAGKQRYAGDVDDVLPNSVPIGETMSTQRTVTAPVPASEVVRMASPTASQTAQVAAPRAPVLPAPPTPQVAPPRTTIPTARPTVLKPVQMLNMQMNTNPSMHIPSAASRILQMSTEPRTPARTAPLFSTPRGDVSATVNTDKRSAEPTITY